MRRMMKIVHEIRLNILDGENHAFLLLPADSSVCCFSVSPYYWYQLSLFRYFSKSLCMKKKNDKSSKRMKKTLSWKTEIYTFERARRCRWHSTWQNFDFRRIRFIQRVYIQRIDIWKSTRLLIRSFFIARIWSLLSLSFVCLLLDACSLKYHYRNWMYYANYTYLFDSESHCLFSLPAFRPKTLKDS